MNISEEVLKAYDVLIKGGVILYPTDTIYGLGCDATNEEAIKKIFKIKNRRISKSFIILLDTVEKLSFYLDHIPVIAWDLTEQATRPTTFIYPNAKNLPDSLISDDGSIAIRIVWKHEFCRRLISILGRPLVSTSANISGQPNPITFNYLAPEIKNAVDYVVPPTSLIEDVKPSTIIRFTGDYSFEVVRE